MLLPLVLAFLLSSFGYLRYSQPVAPPTVRQVLKVADDSKLPIEIIWPSSAQASVGTVEDGLLASKPDQAPRPAASTAKLITVLTVLKEKPLALGESGPLLTITQQDMNLYNNYYAANGSLVAVQLGQQLSEYQMLQGILVRSGNNLADSLAIWAFGSLSEYQIAAQKLVDELGMTSTIVGTDASGLSPTTSSTAEDLTRLGIATMKNDVVREIVKQKTYTLPLDGTMPSTNWLLGMNGVVGIKTGNIPQVGGVFVIASEYIPEGQEPMTIVGAVQGEPTTYEAIVEAGRLSEVAKSLFVKKTIVKKGEVVAVISTPWGETSDVVAEADLATYGWKYTQIKPEVTIRNHTPFQYGAVVGNITIGEASINLVASSTINQPSWQWRLTTSR